MKLLEPSWNGYALISLLAKKCQGICPQLGKTALEKLVYLAQSQFDIDSGYHFTLYTYGPFSSEVLFDLDFLESLEAVEIKQLGAKDGYQIQPGKNADYVEQRAQQFITENSQKIDALINKFGAYNAKQLELRATLAFLEQLGKSGNELVESLRKIKPKYTVHEITEAVKELH